MRQELTIPAEIGQMKSLETLIILRIILNELPDEIVNAPKLNGIEISETSLKRLPRGLEKLQTLRSLTGGENCFDIDPGLNTTGTWDTSIRKQDPRQTCIDNIDREKAANNWVEFDDTFIIPTLTITTSTSALSSLLPTSISGGQTSTQAVTVTTMEKLSLFNSLIQGAINNINLPQTLPSGSIAQTILTTSSLIRNDRPAVITTSSSAPPVLTTNGSEDGFSNSSGSIPVNIAIAIGVGVLVLALLIIGFAVCVGRRRRTTRSWDHINESNESSDVVEDRITGLSSVRNMSQNLESSSESTTLPLGRKPYFETTFGMQGEGINGALEDSRRSGGREVENSTSNDPAGLEEILFQPTVVPDNDRLRGAKESGDSADVKRRVTEYGIQGDGKWVDLGLEWPDNGVILMNNTVDHYIHNWTVDDIQSWLDSMGFNEHVCKVFKDHAIDGPALFNLTDHTLKTKLSFSSSHLRSTILAVRNRALLEGVSSTSNTSSDIIVPHSVLVPPPSSTDEVSSSTLQSPPRAIQFGTRARMQDVGTINEGRDETRRGGRGRQHVDAFESPPPYLGGKPGPSA
ncbi:hypothetical protein HDU67_008784 [Dinochytrium kinnereticum]|nr:hypothetical protein HDU67_008784 [Dinochytrium kinnereticum]